MPLIINHQKAQDLTRKRLRQERVGLLQEQDVLYMRAQEAGESTTAIVAEKQRLRDIPATVDGMETLQELKEASCQS
jgi:hypothetical protein